MFKIKMTNLQRLCRCVHDVNCLSYSKNKTLNMKIRLCKEALEDLLIYVVTSLVNANGHID